MEPYHWKLAELYFRYQKRGWCKMSGRDAIMFWECVAAHAHWAKKLSRLEALAQAAEAGGDEGWLKEIDLQIDRHLMNTTGGAQ